jgi:Phosphoinositide phospholipase C, Ca2+-dependent
MKTFACLMAAIVGIGLLQAGAHGQAAQDAAIRINQIQVIGTHNSYHSGLGPSEMKVLEARDMRTAEALDYGHPPLTQQLGAGIRQIELDVFPDPSGGRFAHSDMSARVAAAGLPPDPDFDPAHEMEGPGFKVMHMQNIDQRSTCHLFVRCLSEVRAWSKMHPAHLPIFILVECKTTHGVDPKGMTVTEAMTPALFDALDHEVLSVFLRKDILTPDQVRGSHASLREVVTTSGWPSLADARGKIIFLLDNRDLAATYAIDHPALKGRLLFPNGDPASPDTAFTELNNGAPAQIEQLVKQGYLVRTRADSDTVQARSNNTRRRGAAIASGAQIISTDYPASEPARWTKYSVSFADGRMAQCNPVNSGPRCDTGQLGDLPAKHP